MLQVAVAVVLFCVMMFGIGFILNMLMKTTWFPIYLFLVVIVPLGVWATWDHNKSALANFTSFTIVDLLPVIGAIIGAYMSGWAIRALRRGGYKMF
ncbi:YuiB family protein [Paenibacillus beijingensis]|nr:YuiB family protein [Paenibacillus beijingensis]